MDTLIEAIKALIIGIVEGITEWLPISSTGHMILVDEFVKLNVSPEFLSLFLVVIQIGAILAVIILYFHKLNPFSPKKTSEQRRGTWRLWGMVVIGCIPAAVIGFALDDWVNEHFYNAWTVAAMLILYGVIFIVMERRNRKREAAYLSDVSAADYASKDSAKPRGKHARMPQVASSAPSVDAAQQVEQALFKVSTVDQIDWKTALKIGLFQVLAIIPGTSRSGATIIGGMLCGCSRTAAAEFTFFLAIPVMFGWGLVKAVKFLAAGIAMSVTEIVVLVVGIVTAFVVSVISIKFLMGYIKKNDFTAFGIYRIIVGIVVLAYFGVKLFL
ncbi:undecaprenyl-diphosphate phosphatase [Adlercreutzia sp. ZJ304]|uniref:undecaprenyl-diphosphate phosphatase n=1 Tax=Adlercreutzia sp. ZJ304 TaxID=2709791 RepID=UPI0013ECB2CA|nr:undecaprenyl-diphosphate phosphatase [Adlercreutzia sp. ZJ304]